MNRTDPVGGVAPGALVSVAVSVTDVPGTTLPLFGVAPVARPGVALLMVICAAPPAPPFSPDTFPTSVARASGSVVPVPGVTGLVGIWNTRNVTLTWHVRLAAGPVAAPRGTVEVGVSDTCPVVGSAAPTVKGTPAQGVVPGSPTAVRTLKMPGSTSAPMQTDVTPLRH